MNSSLFDAVRVAIGLFVLVVGVRAGDWRDKVDSALWTKAAATEAPIEVLITPTTPEEGAIDVEALSKRTQPTERPRVVYAALKSVADASQRDILDWLAKQRIPHRRFVVVNAIVASLPPQALATLAKRADTLRIDPVPVVRAVLPKAEPQRFHKAVAAIEPGVSYIHADDVWTIYGARGAGVVVAGQDTGYRWSHQAIRDQYLGWNGSSAVHDYAWHDAIHSGGGICGPNSNQPCDDHGHGTHTMGTIVGDDGNTNQIGVAPEARWIGCRNMNQGVGTLATYLECFDFFLAPTDSAGQNPDPSRAPHVINNSWGCPPSEGCSSANWDTMRLAIENLTAAGILVVVSAGNDGSACATVSEPPAIFDASFSVGALNVSTGLIAGFSSRGPVTVDGSFRLKPDIAAPGVGVRSSTNNSDSSYGTLSGTSMAGPHVAGAAALLMSAVPQLRRQPLLVRQYLIQSATPVASSDCSSTGVPNNLYGYGRLDVLAAVQAARGEYQFFDGFE